MNFFVKKGEIIFDIGIIMKNLLCFTLHIKTQGYTYEQTECVSVTAIKI